MDVNHDDLGREKSQCTKKNLVESCKTVRSRPYFSSRGYRTLGKTQFNW